MSIKVFKNSKGQIYANTSGQILQIDITSETTSGYKALKSSDNSIYLSPAEDLLVMYYSGSEPGPGPEPPVPPTPVFEGPGWEEKLTYYTGFDAGISSTIVTREYKLYSMEDIPALFAPVRIQGSYYTVAAGLSGDLDQVTCIGQSAFASALWLDYSQTLDFPNVKKIEHYAFREGYGLSFYNDPQYGDVCSVVDCSINYSLPNVEYIGIRAFQGNGFSVISLPKCSFIDQGAFDDCNNLKSVYLLNSTVVSLSEGGSYNPWIFPSASTASYTIYVPASLYDSYLQAQWWSDRYSNRLAAY